MAVKDLRRICQINKKLTLIALKQENSEDDKAVVKNLHLFKGYGSRMLLAESEFPTKKLDETKGGK